MCGVFGAVLPSAAGPSGRRVAALGLFALQHRGQESAGVAVSDGEQLMLYKDLGPGRLRARRAAAAVAPRRPRHRPLPLLHDRLDGLGERPADLPAGTPARPRDRAQRQSREHARAARPARRRSGAAARPSTDTELLTALLADEPAEDTVDALLRVLPRVRGAYSLVVLDERRVIGVRDPLGFRPLVLGRLPVAAASRCRARPVGRRGRRLDPGVRDGGPRHARRRVVRDVEPGEIVVLEQGRAPRSVRFAEPHGQRLVRVRADLLRPARLVHGGPKPLRGAAPDGHGARHRTRRGRRHGHARPGHRRARRGRLRGAGRYPVPRGHGSQPLLGPHLHPALAADAPARRQRQAAARCGRSSATGGSSSSTIRSCAARRPSRSWPCCGAPGRARSTCASAPRRSSIRASTASTPRSRRSSSRRPTRSRRSASSSAPTRSATFRSAGVLAALDLPYERFCFACFDGRYPEPVPYDAGARKFMLEDRRDRSPSPRARRRDVAARPAAAPAYALAGVDVAAGERAVELMREAVSRRAGRRSSGRGFGGFGRAITLPAGYREPLLVGLHRRRGHQDRDRRGRRPVRHRSASTSWRCAPTTSCAPAPSRCCSSTTSRSGALDPDVVAELVGGVAAGCREAGCALVGGETAEHPGLMAADDFDLAGVLRRRRRARRGSSTVPRRGPVTPSSASPHPGCTQTASRSSGRFSR